MSRGWGKVFLEGTFWRGSGEKIPKPQKERKSFLTVKVLQWARLVKENGNRTWSRRDTAKPSFWFRLCYAPRSARLWQSPGQSFTTALLHVLLFIWLEMMDLRFSLSTFTRLMICTAKSMDCVRSFESDMICTSLSPILYHILTNISIVMLRLCRSEVWAIAQVKYCAEGAKWS